jgi:hypothetical protein
MVMAKIRRQQLRTRGEVHAGKETSAAEEAKEGSISQQFAEIVWKYFRSEIEESLAEVEDAMRQNTTTEKHGGHENG